jgi:hypothetical protein
MVIIHRVPNLNCAAIGEVQVLYYVMKKVL